MVGGHQNGVANSGNMIYEWESNFITASHISESAAAQISYF